MDEIADFLTHVPSYAYALMMLPAANWVCDRVGHWIREKVRRWSDSKFKRLCLFEIYPSDYPS